MEKTDQKQQAREALKPCPICSADARLDSSGRNYENRKLFFVHCKRGRCGLRTKNNTSAQKVITVWNKQPALSSPAHSPDTDAAKALAAIEVYERGKHTASDIFMELHLETIKRCLRAALQPKPQSVDLEALKENEQESQSVFEYRYKKGWNDALAAARGLIASTGADAGWMPIVADKHCIGSWFMANSREEMQAFYMFRLPFIREAAREHGYAIGLHGSTTRDLDLMAMIWRENPSKPDVLAKAIMMAACGIGQSKFEWENKPEGRIATSIPICWARWDGSEGLKSLGHIDLSLTAPPIAEKAGE